MLPRNIGTIIFLPFGSGFVLFKCASRQNVQTLYTGAMKDLILILNHGRGGRCCKPKEKKNSVEKKSLAAKKKKKKKKIV